MWERLRDQKVLIILDDVDDLQQLEDLANETNWFGPESKVIITTEDQELLYQHGINNTYHVDFPTEEEARKIFCKYAFRQSPAPEGFEMLVERATELCGNLPLGLRVMGSSLRRKKEDDWKDILHRLESSLDRKIDGVLRVGYNNLHENDQSLFLHIAFFFNYRDDDYVKAMLADSNLDVKLGLKTLAYKSLIQISTEGNVVMHKLLQQVGRQAVQRQEPWKRQILTNAHEICDVLQTEYGSRSVTGISLDISTIPNIVYISKSAFKNMSTLRFLSIYKTNDDTDVRVHVHEDMDFPPCLRLLRWDLFPGKCLPPTFMSQYLVELDLQSSKLEKLWEGVQPLINLKKMDLSYSLSLKELPNLLNATNLETLDLQKCKSLVEIPTSIGNLPKLELLDMDYCVNLQVVPTLFSSSLRGVNVMRCWKLRKTPDFYGNILNLGITDTMLLEELPESISLRSWSRLRVLIIFGSFNQKRIGADIERIPDRIKDLHMLERLTIQGCPKLASLPELPPSLNVIDVDSCESLETLISFPVDSQFSSLCFTNCFKLGREAWRVITQQQVHCITWLTGWEIPAEFEHRAIGNSLTILSGFCRFRFCVMVTPKPFTKAPFFDLLLGVSLNGCPVARRKITSMQIRGEHLAIFEYKLSMEDGWLEQENETMFQFSTTSHEVEVSEFGVRILADETDRNVSICESYESCSEQVFEDEDDETLSDGSYESCSEQVSEDDDDDEILFSDECDEPRVNIFKGYTLVLFSLVFLFLSFILIS